jgi:hypothetical protein
MHRRSAVGRMAGALAAISIGQVPQLDAAVSPGDPSFTVTPENLARSAGLVTCAGCGETADSLELTPAGLCIRCADRNPAVKVSPCSEPFWTLTPQQIRRVERQIQLLSTQRDRMNAGLLKLKQAQGKQDGSAFDSAMEAARPQLLALERELHLLQLLRAASRQFSGSSVGCIFPS